MITLAKNLERNSFHQVSLSGKKGENEQKNRTLDIYLAALFHRYLTKFHQSYLVAAVGFEPTPPKRLVP